MIIFANAGKNVILSRKTRNYKCNSVSKNGDTMDNYGNTSRCKCYKNHSNCYTINYCIAHKNVTCGRCEYWKSGSWLGFDVNAITYSSSKDGGGLGYCYVTDCLGICDYCWTWCAYLAELG